MGLPDEKRKTINGKRETNALKIAES